MGYIKYASDVTAPVDIAFAYTDNPLSIPHWMAGAVDCTQRGDVERGIGAHYGLRFRYGPWRPVFDCEIVQHRRDAVLGFALRGPLTARLTLRFDPLGRGRSVLTCELDYDRPRGSVAGLGNQPLESLLRTVLRRTEARLRREIEEFHGTDLVGRFA